jgi:hypothetical protein
VEGLFVDHDLGLLDALVMAELARQLERGFVGLQAAGAEEDLVQPRALAQHGGQSLGVGRVVVVAGVDQLGDLLLQRGNQLGVGVAQGVDRDAAECIQVFLAVDVPDAAAVTVRERDRQAAVGVHDMRFDRSSVGHGEISKNVKNEVSVLGGPDPGNDRVASVGILGPVLAGFDDAAVRLPISRRHKCYRLS